MLSCGFLSKGHEVIASDWPDCGPGDFWVEVVKKYYLPEYK